MLVSKPIDFACALAPELPERVEGDPVRLRQVLVNLLHNAVKFTERGRIALEVSARGRVDGAVRVRFEVRDTGIGIAKEQFDSVFDAFTQVDASSTRRHGGSGLGLAIVKEIAELMGGDVGVDSRVDEGSTFWFEVPLGAVAAVPAEDGVGAAGDVPTARILVAEDDAVSQLVVATMLKKMGCVVDVVADGEAAGLAAAAVHYDLILMDCHMPGIDGFEATRRIRDDEFERSRGHTPIVALTADALAGDRERCIESGMDDYMTKPVSSAMLAACVERWTGRKTTAPSQW